MVELTIDDHIWCEDCQQEIQDEHCKIHGAFIPIKDKCIPTKAKLTMPHSLTYKVLEMTADNSDVYGVFAKKAIKARSMFGPYEGINTKDWHHNGNDRIKLHVFEVDNNYSFLDCSDEETCNWMMFVRPAIKKQQQNLVAFQYKAGIYFTAIRRININEELQVWYSTGYENRLHRFNVPHSNRGNSNHFTVVSTAEEKEGVFKDNAIIIDPNTTRTRLQRRNKSQRITNPVVVISETDADIEADNTLYNFDDDDVAESVVDSVADSVVVPLHDVNTPQLANGNVTYAAQSNGTTYTVEIMPWQSLPVGSVLPVTPVVPVYSMHPVTSASVSLSASHHTSNSLPVTVQSLLPVTSSSLPVSLVTSKQQNTGGVKKKLLLESIKSNLKSRKGKVIRKSNKTVDTNSDSVTHVLIQDQDKPEPEVASLSLTNTKPRDDEHKNKTSNVKVKNTSKSREKTKQQKRGKKSSAGDGDDGSCDVITGNKADDQNLTEKKYRFKKRNKNAVNDATATWSCPSCNEVLPTLKKFIAHKAKHTNGYKCEEEDCGKVFRDHFQLSRHMAVHRSGAKFYCSYCAKEFFRKDHLKSHLRIHNPNRDTLKCVECGKDYHSKLAFKVHMAYHKLETGDLECFVCQKIYPDKSALDLHLKFHSGSYTVKNEADKKQKCTYCDKRFFKRLDLDRHIITHTRERPFMCHLCPKTFGRDDHLTRHLALHKTGKVSIKTTSVSTVKRPRKSKSIRTKAATTTMRRKSRKQRSQQHFQVIESTSNEVVFEFNTGGGDGVVGNSATEDDTFSSSVGNLDTTGAAAAAAASQSQQQTSSLIRNQKTIQLESVQISTNDVLPTSSDVTSFLTFLNNTDLKQSATAATRITTAAGKIKRPTRAVAKRKLVRHKRSSASSRSSLTSQPTIDISQLPGTSHLQRIAPRKKVTSPPPPQQRKPEVGNVVQSGTAGMIPTISIIDKMELDDQSKIMHKHVEAQLKKLLLQSVTSKNTTVTIPVTSAHASTAQLQQQQHALPVMYQVATNGAPVAGVTSALLPTTVQQPSLKTINTEMLIQQILDSDNIINVAPAMTVTQTAPPSGGGGVFSGNTQTQQQHVMQLIEPNINPTPEYTLHTTLLPPAANKQIHIIHNPTTSSDDTTSGSDLTTLMNATGTVTAVGDSIQTNASNVVSLSEVLKYFNMTPVEPNQ